MGFLPQELLGTSMYEYYHHDDIPHLAESHKAALQISERVTTQVINIDYLQSLFCNYIHDRIKIIIISVNIRVTATWSIIYFHVNIIHYMTKLVLFFLQFYRFRSKDANFVRLQSEWKSFRNPWTKDIEYLIAKNSAILWVMIVISHTSRAWWYKELSIIFFSCDTRPIGNNGSGNSSVQDNYDYFTQSKCVLKLCVFARLLECW